ncbi:polyphosphate kinase 2 [Asticcacaulis sp. EMRT-3]|uniref:polyphosphate kinase 2 n=1 Tax=Asticcacaulis sp. EMRT-3 TaxID=3040349 RepID=UPI0024AF4AE9|nr:polyphosphate kinase 2 [Asticcacaulis sp. EMRT-3]MDI7774081.1 polyphosphate kinase 2 [Asticcacaulis sp. EMRT-3]
MSKKTPKPLKSQARIEKLQIALVDTQIWTLAHGRKVCIVMEGRDAAGKDGSIKRLTECLSVRNTHVVALPKPTDAEEGQWWFQRYVNRLPTTGEWTIYNRSWYNRAGVEKVMGFSSPEKQEIFIRDVPDFESMIVRSGINLIKFWLDISREEQKERLDARRSDPRKRLKVSDLDKVAQERWDDYSAARDEMLKRSHHDNGRWICVATDSKKKARENILRHVLKVIDCPHGCDEVAAPDPDILFDYDEIIEGRRALQP